VYTTNCNCAGTPGTDSDGDGICDSNDQCPNFNDNLIGLPCNDNDPCTVGETWNSNCNCSGGVYTDNDNDGECIGLDADDNDACVPDNSDPNCNQGGCQVYNTNDFEATWGIWNDGGTDSQRRDNGLSNNSGIRSIRLRDNSGVASSMFTDNIDFSAYAEIIVSFSFIAESMEPGEDFFLEASADGGSSYTIIEEWNSGVEFNNGSRQNPSVSISSNYLSSNTIIRIRCDASANGDRILVDDVTIETCGTSLKAPQDQVVTRENTTNSTTRDVLELNLYPNPASEVLNVELKGNMEEKISKIEFFSSFGQLIKTARSISDQECKIELDDLPEGQAFIVVLTTESGKILVERFVKI